MDHPLGTLRTLAENRSSGEFIAVLESAEVHVYLKHGRVAWAIASDSPGTLMRYLAEECKLYRHEIEAVVRDCRDNRRPLGEGLIAWGFATQDQVRAALQKQIYEVFQRLAQAHEPVRSLFIPRAVDYAEELTFDLEEVDSSEAESGPPPSRSPRHLLRDLWRSLPSVSWVQIRSENGTTVSAVAPEASLPEADVHTLLGLDFTRDLFRVTVRTRGGSIVGQAIADRATAWCGLERTGNLGLVNAALGAHAPVAASTPPSERARSFALETLGEYLLDGSNVAPAFSDMPELVGVFLTRTTGSAPDATAATELSGTHRVPQHLPEIASKLLGFRHLLEVSVSECFPRSEPVWDTLSPESASVLCEDERYFYFGRRSEGVRGAQIWVVMQRSESRGLGWALLEALARAPAAVDQRVA
jgi:hypothetical protein